MGIYLGIDTSNYTTSLAAYNSLDNTLINQKQLLKVKKGEKGLRQNEAVFQHVLALPDLIEELFDKIKGKEIHAIAVSDKPRNIEGSYMPCFQAGLSFARALATFLQVPIFTNSHQVGHILASIYSINKPDLLNEKFIAFHVSGGTTEALLVSPCQTHIIKTDLIAKTLDLNAGQAIDRVGVALGLAFPSGPMLEELALKSTKTFKIKPVIKGYDCCLSGLENLCVNMIESGSKAEDVASFCIEYIKETLEHMLINLLNDYGDLPLVFSGGVMANTIIRNFFTSRYKALFPKPEFSADNAGGIAYYGFLKGKKDGL